MTPTDIRAESAAAWERLFADAMRKCQYDRAFPDMIRDYEMKAETEAIASLQPWLHILDDSIQWLANLWGVVSVQFERDDCSNVIRSIWALLGASCSHAVAVRRLVLSGLDTPARAATRALDEHLCACIAMLHDRSLAEGFQRSQDAKDSNEFWYRNLNTKALGKSLNAVEREIGLEPTISQDMREWRGWEMAAFSQAIHPSYITSALTVKTIDATNPNAYAVAIFGKASAGSERTLNFACKSIWYFSRMGFLILFNQYRGLPPLIALDKEDEMQQMAVVGREVLSELNRKYWDYEIYSREEEA